MQSSLFMEGAVSGGIRWFIMKLFLWIENCTAGTSARENSTYFQKEIVCIILRWRHYILIFLREYYTVWYKIFFVAIFTYVKYLIFTQLCIVLTFAEVNCESIKKGGKWNWRTNYQWENCWHKQKWTWDYWWIRNRSWR